MEEKLKTSNFTQVNTLADTDYLVGVRNVNGVRTNVKIAISDLKQIFVEATTPPPVVNSLYDTFESYLTTKGGVTTNAKKQKLETLLNGIESGTLINKLKALYLFEGGNADSILINAVRPYTGLYNYEASMVGSVIIDPNGGVTPSSANYLVSGVNPTGVGMDDLSGAMIAFYSPTALTPSEYTTGLYNYFYYAPGFNDAGKGYFELGNNFKEITTDNRAGLHMVNRQPNFGLVKTYYNNTVTNTINDAAYIGSYNINSNSFSSTANLNGLRDGNTNLPSTNKMSMVCYSLGLTDSEALEFTNLITNYYA
jgi:hypothetical protein